MTIAPPADDDSRFMARALELARRGEGLVEPNPMVGCVLVNHGGIVGEGWHRRYGGPHAEIEALASAGTGATGATAYVTLEPCNHLGKTPPCTQALIAAGVSRVVAACRDPNPLVDGRGLAALAAAGVSVQVGPLQSEAADLIAPFAKLVVARRPWVIAKWAMSLDGKIATGNRDSRWVSNEQSRRQVHLLRGRVDAIVVGRRTVDADDPLLTVRPPGPRTPLRIVLDAEATLSLDSRLVATARQAPVLVAASSAAPQSRCQALVARGVEVWQSNAGDPMGRWQDLLDELGRRQLTNVLVEGGAQVLGSLLDAQAIDEVHVFIGPKLVGGAGPSAIAGRGAELMQDALAVHALRTERLGDDLYLSGRIH